MRKNRREWFLFIRRSSENRVFDTYIDWREFVNDELTEYLFDPGWMILAGETITKEGPFLTYEAVQNRETELWGE